MCYGHLHNIKILFKLVAIELGQIKYTFALKLLIFHQLVKQK